MSVDEQASVIVTACGSSLYTDETDERGAELRAAGGMLNMASHDIWAECLDLMSWDVVVDVGASYGEMLAHYDLGRFRKIIAFEPNRRVLPYLKKTLDDLPWDVDVFDSAVSAHSAADVPFVADSRWSGRSTLAHNVHAFAPEEAAVDVEHVRTTTLDATLSSQGFKSACIKIDVEGEEWAVLDGARRTFDRFESVVCMVEILHMPVEGICQLARTYPLFLFEKATGRLVQHFGQDRDALGRALHSGQYHRQDAVLVAGTKRQALGKRIRRANPPSASPTRVVYTALFGNYEALQEQPLAQDSDVPFVCFTDDPSLTSETWDVRLVDLAYPMDAVRSARTIKIQGHPSIAAFDQLLWVDNRVTLKMDPAQIMAELLDDADIAVFEHSFRDLVVDEFDAVVYGGYDEPARVYEQLLHYAETHPDILNERPLWTGFFARRNNGAVADAMGRWMSHVLRYSKRDQLSVNLTLSDADVQLKRLAGSNRESAYHEWPMLSASLGRKPRTRPTAFDTAIRAPLARLRAVEREHDDLREAASESEAQRAATIKSLERRLADAERVAADSRRLKALLEEARAAYEKRNAQVAELEQELAALKRRGDEHAAGSKRLAPAADAARR